VIIRFEQAHSVKEMPSIGELTSLIPADYSTQANLVRIPCDEKGYEVPKTEYYSETGKLVMISVPLQPKTFAILDRSPMRLLHDIICKPAEATK